MTDDRRRVVPSLIGMLHDVDTSTAVPADGDALVWDATAKLWKPGAAAAAVPVVRDTASAANTFANPATITIPSTVHVGDPLVLAWGSFYPPTGDPTGWTRLSLGTATGGANPLGFGCWHKIAVSGDIGSTVTVSGTPGSDWAVLVLAAFVGSAVRGAQQTLGTASVAAGGNVSTPSITVVTNDLLVSVFAVEAGTATPAFTYGPGITTIVEQVNSFPLLAIAVQPIVATGTVGPRTASPSKASSWASASLDIQS